MHAEKFFIWSLIFPCYVKYRFSQYYSSSFQQIRNYSLVSTTGVGRKMFKYLYVLLRQDEGLRISHCLGYSMYSTKWKNYPFIKQFRVWDVGRW